MATIIIGAGMSGLSTAYYLEKSNEKNYLVLEANSEVGGLCRTVRKNSFVFDFAPHMFFFGDREATQLVKDLLGENLILKDRKHGIFINGKVIPYPFQYNLFHLDEETRKECLKGVIEASGKFDKNKTPKDFLEWIQMTLGDGILKHFMLPYNKKCYSVHPAELTIENVGRYIPKPQFREIIQGANQDLSKLDVGYNYQFGYSKEGGIDAIPKALTKRVQNIKLNEKVMKINLEMKKVLTNNSAYSFDNLVSTMPIKKLIEIIEDAPEEIKNAAKKLRCNSVCVVVFGVSRPKISEHQVLYVPNEDFLTYRLSFPANYGENVTPPNESLVCAEWAYLEDKKFSDIEIIEKTISDLIKMRFLKNRDEIVFTDFLKLENAYAIFDSERNENLKIIQDFLLKNNVYSIGQFGAWERSSMDDAILCGKKTAEKLSENSKSQL